MEAGTASAGAAVNSSLSLNVKPVQPGQLFPSRAELRLAVETEAAAEGRAIQNAGSGGGRNFSVTCKTCRTWFVKGCRQSTKEFKVTKVGKEHLNCVGSGSMPSKVAKPLVDQLVRANSKIDGPVIKRTLKTAGLDMGIRDIQRAKKTLVDVSKEEEADAISRLPAFFEAIERDCPGSVATIERTTENRFVRSFAMTGKAAFVAANSTPKVVLMDAGHLKGSWKGVMYILSAKDSNNRIIHVSTVLADKENETNYRFLLEQTCKNEHMARFLKSAKTTFFMDGHRGSPPALRRTAPDAQLHTCVRHLITNKTMVKMGAEVSGMVYKAAKMPSRALFDECLEEVKTRFPRNFRFLMSQPLETWAHHASPKDLVILDTTTSNNAESTINMVGAQARTQDVFHLHQKILEHSTERLAGHAQTGLGSGRLHTPFATNFIENERKLSLTKHVKDMGLGVYLVQEHGHSKYGNRVNLELPDAEGQGGSLHCTCDVPSRFKMPCQDALAVFKEINRLDVAMKFVDDGYTLEAYRNVHANPDFPVTLPIWSELSKTNLLPPRQVQGQAGAPKRGRPKRSRIPGANDNCQRGRGGGGRGAAAAAPAFHGSGSVRSHVGHLGVGGIGVPPDGGAPAPRVWGGVAAQRYSSQEPSGSGAGVSGGQNQNLSQGSVVDITG